MGLVAAAAATATAFTVQALQADNEIEASVGIRIANARIDGMKKGLVADLAAVGAIVVGGARGGGAHVVRRWLAIALL